MEVATYTSNTHARLGSAKITRSNVEEFMNTNSKAERQYETELYNTYRKLERQQMQSRQPAANAVMLEQFLTELNDLMREKQEKRRAA